MKTTQNQTKTVKALIKYQEPIEVEVIDTDLDEFNELFKEASKSLKDIYDIDLNDYESEECIYEYDSHTRDYDEYFDLIIDTEIITKEEDSIMKTYNSRKAIKRVRALVQRGKSIEEITKITHYSEEDIMNIINENNINYKFTNAHYTNQTKEASNTSNTSNAKQTNETKEETKEETNSGFFSFIGSIIGTTYDLVKEAVLYVIDKATTTVGSAVLALLSLLSIDIGLLTVNAGSELVGYIALFDPTSLFAFVSFLIFTGILIYRVSANTTVQTC